jgi:hypothetical protein
LTVPNGKERYVTEPQPPNGHAERSERGERDNGRPALALSFRPHAGLLTPVRDFVSAFCGTFLRDPDMIYRIAITVHELLENAIKYSIDGATEITIELRTQPGASHVSIRTENRASRESILAVRDLIDRIHGAEDPFVFYCDLMRASLERNEGSGLGLARIRAEAGLEIHSAVFDDHVSVFAEARIDHGSLV